MSTSTTFNSVVNIPSSPSGEAGGRVPLLGTGGFQSAGPQSSWFATTGTGLCCLCSDTGIGIVFWK